MYSAFKFKVMFHANYAAVTVLIFLVFLVSMVIKVVFIVQLNMFIYLQLITWLLQLIQSNPIEWIETAM